MNRILLRWSAIALSTGLLTAVLPGCAVEAGGPGYGYGGGDVAVGVDYYEPAGVIYGGWGPGYRVGPYRNGGGEYHAGGGAHAYRPAGPSRSIPSIPSRSRESR